MISINDVDCEYLWGNNQIEFTEDVKERWNSMSEQDRSQYFTTEADRIRLYATHVLDDLFEQLENNYDIEDLYLRLVNDMPVGFVKRFQQILDEICEFPSAEFFKAAEKIDQTIDLKEV